MPGPAREPTALKLAKGNPGKRPISDKEPKPEGDPVAPPWLRKGPSGKARHNVWRRLVPKLVNAGLATIVDSEALARYVDLLVQWQELRTFLDENGYAYPLRSAPTAREIRKAAQEDREPLGEVRELRAFPQVAQFNRVTNELRQLEDRFGMTPSARTRIEVEPLSGSTPNGLTPAQLAILAG